MSKSQHTISTIPCTYTAARTCDYVLVWLVLPGAVN
jgi:hypothetical protein